MDGAGVEFRLLGPVDVRVGGRPVEVGAARQRCVLAALLVDANRGVSTDQLVERVWGGRGLPKRPRKAAQIYVSLLRGALAGIERVAIPRRPDGYAIELDESSVDVHEFHRLLERARARGDERDAGDDAVALLERALGLWRGEAFGALDTPWLADVRTALNQERQTAERELTDLQLRQGRHGMLLARLSSWAQEHPLDERLAGQLMLALFRDGRQADALEAYRRVRERLARELGADPSRTLQELHRRILTDDPALTAAPARAFAARGDPAPAEPAVPRQLPAAPRWFTGRRAELDALLKQLGRLRDTDGAGGVVAISALDGMAGVGKTALAVHAAHRLAKEFPDGQLFIDLRGYTQGFEPRMPGEALDRLLRALDVPPQRIPEEAEDRAALYRQRLCGTRTLIVLDNAVDEAQVRPLLPGTAGCLVLVTSRRRLKGLDDAHGLSLDMLPPADALALLRTVAGPERLRAGDPALAEIADLCGRLPLALRIAGALLRHRPAWNPDWLAELLRQEHRRVDALSDGERDLGALFDLSYRSLTAAHQQLFRRLGLIPGPDTEAHAGAALADVEPVRAHALLEDLVDHNLLMQHAPGRYGMHDLVRLHARALAGRDPADERDAALDRLLDYYQHTASRAEDLVSRFPGLAAPARAPAYPPALPDPGAAWTWLRAERPNLLAALRHTAAHGRPERSIALTANLAGLLRADGPWPQAITLHAAAADTADRLGDRRGRAHALIWSGDLRGVTGDFAGAARDLREAADIARDLGDRPGQANALIRLGQVSGFLGDHPAAIRDLCRGLELFGALGVRRGQANGLTLLGQVRGMTGDFPGAARDLRRALDIARDLGDRPGQANALSRLGLVRKRTGHFPAAVRDLQQALAVYRDSGDRLGQANALAGLGEVRCAAGDHAGALRDLHDAADLFQALGEQLGQANVLTTRGRVRGLTGDHPRALRDLREALGLYERIGAHGNKAPALNGYATSLAATGDRARALMVYGEALRLARQTLQPENEGEALEGIGECGLGDGDVEAGLAHLKQALEIFLRLSMGPDADRVQGRLSRIGS